MDLNLIMFHNIKKITLMLIFLIDDPHHAFYNIYEFYKQTNLKFKMRLMFDRWPRFFRRRKKLPI